MKHTPKPWVTVDREVMEDGSIYPAHILGGPNELQVCLLESPGTAELIHAEPHNFIVLQKFQNSNARLIAAAPDLLDELLACEKHLHEFVEAIEWGGGAASKSAARLKQVQAAIAKATGETA